MPVKSEEGAESFCLSVFDYKQFFLVEFLPKQEIFTNTVMVSKSSSICAPQILCWIQIGTVCCSADGFAVFVSKIGSGCQKFQQTRRDMKSYET
jgi:hypothetical protein